MEIKQVERLESSYDTAFRENLSSERTTMLTCYGAASQLQPRKLRAPASASGGGVPGPMPSLLLNLKSNSSDKWYSHLAKASADFIANPQQNEQSAQSDCQSTNIDEGVQFVFDGCNGDFEIVF
jgi:hypothetical protein